MTRTMIAVIVLMTLLAVAAVTSLVQGKQEKVTICHKPAGSNPHTITVAQPAVNAHMNHGDTAGACASSPTK